MHAKDTRRVRRKGETKNAADASMPEGCTDDSRIEARRGARRARAEGVTRFQGSGQRFGHRVLAGPTGTGTTKPSALPLGNEAPVAQLSDGAKGNGT